MLEGASFFFGGGFISHIRSGAELRDCIVAVVGVGKSPAQSAARGPRRLLVPLKVQNTDICLPPHAGFCFSDRRQYFGYMFLRSGSTFANNYSLPLLSIAQSV